jgi:hypothetical protein
MLPILLDDSLFHLPHAEPAVLPPSVLRRLRGTIVAAESKYPKLALHSRSASDTLPGVPPVWATCQSQFGWGLRNTSSAFWIVCAVSAMLIFVLRKPRHSDDPLVLWTPQFYWEICSFFEVGSDTGIRQRQIQKANKT